MDRFALRVAVLVGAVLLLAVGAAPAAADDIEQRLTVEKDDEVTLTFAYTIPDRLHELTINAPVVGKTGATVKSTRGFERTNATAFEWTGANRPTITLTLHSNSRLVSAGQNWAFVVRPNLNVSYQFYNEPPEFDTTYRVAGRGYSTDALAYVGPYQTLSVTADGERTTLIVADAAGAADTDRAEQFLHTAPGRFDLGVRRSESVAFVLPVEKVHEGRQLSGATVENAFWVDTDAVAMTRTGNAFTHEYVHTRLGVVGTGSARWLTEGSAEYFGHAFALNYGVGSYEQFRRALRDGKTDAVLSEPSTWDGTLANYEKGALVLAALDAEIRSRTGGERTLADVFTEHPGPYDSHAEFRQAVVATTDRQLLGAWLDRYVAGGATPTLPEEPDAFVYGADLDPDHDGVESGQELAASRHPFVADSTVETTTTRTATATATRTPTATSTPAAATPPTTLTIGEVPGLAVAAALLVVLFAELLSRRR